MSLRLGKLFNRNYNMRLPFLNGFYDIGIFFNIKSTFLLFSVDKSSEVYFNEPVNINMYKNLESSKFCEVFLNLHNYKGKKLDIINQVESIKPEQQNECHQILNENIITSKIIDDDREFFDSLNIYNYTIQGYENSIIFLVAERQHIVSRIGKKIVRTTGIQISSVETFKVLNEYYEEFLEHNNFKNNIV